MRLLARRTPKPAGELESLRRWKAEATAALTEWEAVWEAAGRPGPLGASKAESVRKLIENLTKETKQ